MMEEMLMRELISLLRENNRLLKDISDKLENLVEPTWAPPVPYPQDVNEQNS